MNLDKLIDLTGAVYNALRDDVNKNSEIDYTASLESDIMMQVGNYSIDLERIKGRKFNIDADIIGLKYFSDICNTIKEYLDKRGFKPLAETKDYKSIFSNILRLNGNNCMNLLLLALLSNHDALRQFDMDNYCLVSSNLVFADDKYIEMNNGYFAGFSKDLPKEVKRASRPMKVRYKLDMVSKDVLDNELSRYDVLTKYCDGGFDKLCPGDVKDMSRCLSR